MNCSVCHEPLVNCFANYCESFEMKPFPNIDPQQAAERDQRSAQFWAERTKRPVDESRKSSLFGWIAIAACALFSVCGMAWVAWRASR